MSIEVRSIELDESEWAQIEALAKREGSTASMVVREALRAYGNDAAAGPNQAVLKAHEHSKRKFDVLYQKLAQ